jgi:hypothetical protein
VAVSITAASFASAGQSFGTFLFPGTTSPLVLACLRQVYRVTSEIPSCRANSATDRFWGGNSFFRTDSLRSSE